MGALFCCDTVAANGRVVLCSFVYSLCLLSLRQIYVATFTIQTFVLLLSKCVRVLDIQFSPLLHCGELSHIQMRRQIDLCISNYTPQCPV